MYKSNALQINTKYKIKRKCKLVQINTKYKTSKKEIQKRKSILKAC